MPAGSKHGGGSSALGNHAAGESRAYGRRSRTGQILPLGLFQLSWGAANRQAASNREAIRFIVFLALLEVDV